MGLHDTVKFDKPRSCPTCGRAIESVQLSAEGFMEEFIAGDCVSHAEDLAVVREQLYCNDCKDFKQYVYLSVYRGILLGNSDSLEEAKQILDRACIEKIVLLYHDLFRKYQIEQRTRRGLQRFLRDAVRWFCEEQDKRKLLFFVPNFHYFEHAADPIEAIKCFLEDEEAATTEEENEHGPEE